MIKVMNLTKIYKSKKTGECIALDNISFTLPDTGMVFVIGKSGSGKSTLLNLIGGLDTITSGDIIADGIDIKSLKNDGFDKYRSSYLTFVFQDYKLFEGLSVKENVQVGLDITDSYEESMVLEAIEKVGLKGYENRYPFELSGGEQQRVSIARSLVRDSKIILADEPTGNLDARTTKQVLDLLKVISKERLVVIVSHNLGDADIYADQIIELHEGKVLSNKVKTVNYSNEYRIESNKAYLPHYHDLGENEVEELYENIKSGNVKEVVQIDNGFNENNDIESNERIVSLDSKSATNKSLLKLLKMFLKKKLSSRILAIVFSVLIFLVLSILQSFVLFDPSPTKLDSDEKYYVLHKGDTSPLDLSMRTAELYGIVDSDIDSLMKSGYSEKYYMLSNYGHDYSSCNNNYTYGLHNVEDNFYFSRFTGTLKCDYDLLVDLFGVNGEVKVLAGNLYEKSYGIIITDYMADAMIYYKNSASYQNMLGNSVSEYVYVNAIIDTNYEEEFKDIKNFYAKSKQYETLELFTEDLLKHKDYEKYMQHASRFLSISYTFCEKIEKELIEANQLYCYPTNLSFCTLEEEVSDFSSSTYSTIYRASSEKISSNYKDKVPVGKMYMYYSTYNNIFGTAYTTTNYSLEANNKITLRLYNTVNGEKVLVYEKEYEILGLATSNIFHEEDFEEMVDIQIRDYGIYLLNNEYANEIIKIGNDLHFYLKTVDFDSGLMIIKLTSAFETLFLIILVVVYIVLFGYIILNGINTVKGNKVEIGIYKALGGRFINIGKVLLIDTVLTGFVIVGISVIVTPIMLSIADSILVNSFEQVIGTPIFHMSIIKVFAGVLSINFSTLLFAVILSAVIPALWLFTLKPIQIIKE